MARALLVLGMAVLAAVAGLVIFLGVSASTPAITDEAGKELPGSIAALETVELGGLEQWILIRGRDRSNPVLLWLHGGPGGAQMPLAHHVDRELEDHFVMVHWDQRGAGKSNHRGFDEETMRFERYLQDALELVEYLKVRLEVDEVVLLGHSWGSRLGLHLVEAHPELFRAYVGVSQVVDHDRATELARDWLLEAIDPEQSPDDLERLRDIPIPARRHSDYRQLARLVERHGGGMDVSLRELAGIASRAPEYTALDHLRLLRGLNRGGAPLHEDGRMEPFNFMEEVPSVKVPVRFLMGRGDRNTPLALVEEYHQALEAPGKELVIFEESAHLPFLAEPRRFRRELIRAAAPEEAAAPARTPPDRRSRDGSERP